jgi:DNA-directed RNA polymerase specialized sigma24 family protein
MAATDGKFPTTEWTLISRLHSRDSEVAQKALNELCEQYHYPLYCYVRRRGLDHHDAQDALHEFLLKLLRLRSFQGLREEHGRLQGFLAMALDRFLANWHRDHARQRATSSLDCENSLSDAEKRFRHERLRDEESPQRLFERKWALELLQHVVTVLREKYAMKGREPLFRALLPAIKGQGSLRGEESERIAAELGMTVGALRVAMSRLLKDYREILRAEVRQTVSRNEDVDGELRHLMSLFTRR